MSSSMSRTRPYSARVLDSASDHQYGLYVRPSPQLGAAALDLMNVFERQFGFHSAQKYAPHITLVGGITLDATPERVLIDRLGTVLDAQPPFPMFTDPRLGRHAGAIVADVDKDEDGSKNTVLQGLVARLFEAVADIRIVPATVYNAAILRTQGAHDYVGHLSVLGEDWRDNPDVADEAYDYATALDPLSRVPLAWTATHVHLCRFWSADWSSRYWETLEWTIVRSWELRSR